MGSQDPRSFGSARSFGAMCYSPCDFLTGAGFGGHVHLRGLGVARVSCMWVPVLAASRKAAGCGEDAWGLREKEFEEKEERWMRSHESWLEERRYWEAVKRRLLLEVSSLKLQSQVLKEELRALEGRVDVQSLMSAMQDVETLLARAKMDAEEAVGVERVGEDVGDAGEQVSAMEVEFVEDGASERPNTALSRQGETRCPPVAGGPGLEVVRNVPGLISSRGPDLLACSETERRTETESRVESIEITEIAQANAKLSHQHRELRELNVHAYVHNALRASYMRRWMRNRIDDFSE